MDALMAALVAALVATAPDRAASSAAIATRPGRTIAIGLLVAAAMASIATGLGIALAPRLAPAARLLMLAVALGFVGVEFLVRRLPASPAEGIAAALAGSGLWFVVAMLAMRSPLPWMAVPGAIIGTTAALAIAIAAGRDWARLPLAGVRRIVGTLFLAVGAILACTAIGIV